MQGIHAVTGPQAAKLLEQAVDAERRARRDEALDLLAGCAEWPTPYQEQGLLLRADVLTAREAIAGLQELAAHADAFNTADARVGYFLSSARAYMKARNLDAAEAMLESAQAALGEAHESRAYEVAYARARLSWNRREYDPQNEDLAFAIRSSDAAVRFNALNLRAWMHAGHENYRATMADLVACLRVYREHGLACGIANVAGCVQSIFGISYELLDFNAEREAELVFDTIEWTPDLESIRYQSLRSLAWCAFLRGDSARAQWLLKDSKDAAPSDAWKTMAHVDRAYIARVNLNDAWAAEELYEAHGLARKVDWHATRDEERMALVMLAVLFAPIDLGHAQRYVSTFIELGSGNLSPAIEASHDPRRAVAAQKYAAGRVHGMLGNKSLGIRNLEEAYRMFSELEFDFRAALVAEALYELTNDTRWQQTACIHAAKFPACAIAQRLNAPALQSKNDEPEGLTLTQRQIAIAHCQGVEVEDLSRRFSRSTFTIEKQLQAIYAAFGVRSRSGLRDELHRRGLL
jgi:hypothetical protein